MGYKLFREFIPVIKQAGQRDNYQFLVNFVDLGKRLEDLGENFVFYDFFLGLFFN